MTRCDSHRTGTRGARSGLARFAEVSGATDPATCVAESRALLIGDRARAGDAFTEASQMRRALVQRGFRDDPSAFTLGDMLARRGGNCLGITLLLGAALIDRGFDPRVAVRINPFDDVHDAGNEHLAALLDAKGGVDADSRLPDARDRTRRFRFVPVEHASLVLGDASGGERPFETTSLVADVDPGWSPRAESMIVGDYPSVSSAVWSERAKSLLHEMARSGVVDDRGLRRSVALALRAARAWPQNAEAWAEVWRAARLLAEPPRSAVSTRFARLATFACNTYARAERNDSLFAFTRYRMTGEEQLLDDALARFPAYAEAYFEKHVTIPLAQATSETLDALRRHCAVAAWMVAESEILDLERFYRQRESELTRLFSAAELEELLASFARTEHDPSDSRG